VTPPPLTSTSQPKAVSLGISDFSPWDLEMANMGYQVLQYDASIKKAPDTHKNMIFHRKFVGAMRDHQTITFEDIIQQYSFDEKAHNILQMDIEGAEWEIFEKLDFNILEKYFSQIILEFHDCDPRSSLQTERHVAILEKFHHAFHPIHLHYNPNGYNFYVKDRFMSSLLEVSYARKDLLPKDFALRNECGDIPYLDYPNLEKQPNIPILFQ
ncbi:FkbM family methyltransferase, partial [Helicobacter trogontum]|uniref:FkbM family methyltransferase n=1 Tax=Helicobacter trogontum TaxID=50960 RepID=UPI002A91D123